MRIRSLISAGLLFLAGGCSGDAVYHQSNYEQQPNSVAGYYPADYATPYQPSSPVYGSPYVSGPLVGGIYSYGDAEDYYGGPIFSPFRGIRCDRRRDICWSRSGPDPRWTARYFGRRHADWSNGGYWRRGNWNYSNGNNGHWGNGGGNHPGNGNRPYVYQVPQEPDGSGTPTFIPNP